MEVIYLGLRQTPEMIVSASVQEDADVIALSILSGAHMTIFPRVLELMKKEGIGERLLTGGGIIPEQDIANLKKMAGVLTVLKSARPSFLPRNADADSATPSSALTLHELKYWQEHLLKQEWKLFI